MLPLKVFLFYGAKTFFKIAAFVDNTVNDLRYEIKFENCVEDKNININ